MIKKLHYCWFGGNQKTKLINKCIESWKKYFPDYEIVEWNESNFDVNCNTYVRQAYECKKYAFVSDYVRFFVLEKYGGLYFDTDVEVIKPFDELMGLHAFSGFENDVAICAGLVLYAEAPGDEIITKTRIWYDNAAFLDKNGERIKKNVCDIFTGILTEYGFVPNGKKQQCGGMTLFPKDYFCPFDDTTGILRKTKNTYSIHWFSKSWMSKRKKMRNKITRIIHRIFGVEFSEKIKKLIFAKGKRQGKT